MAQQALRAADPEEVAAALSYAMRFDERGRAWRTGHEYAVGLEARQLAAQVALSNFLVMRRPPVVRNGPDGR